MSVQNETTYTQDCLEEQYCCYRTQQQRRRIFHISFKYALFLSAILVTSLATAQVAVATTTSNTSSSQRQNQIIIGNESNGVNDISDTKHNTKSQQRQHRWQTNNIIPFINHKHSDVVVQQKQRYLQNPREECYNSLVFSDQNENSSIEQNEYVILVNEISGVNFFGSLELFDSLPLVLKALFEELAGPSTTGVGGIYIFGAKDNEIPDNTQATFLANVCDEITEVVNIVMSEETTTAPTIILNPTMAPVTTPGGTGNDCYDSLAFSDQNDNSRIERAEYIVLANEISGVNFFGTVEVFDSLPLVLKALFEEFAGPCVTCEINIFGVYDDETPDDRQATKLANVCDEVTEVVNIVMSEATTAPTIMVNPTIAPTTTSVGDESILLPRCYAAMSLSDTDDPLNLMDGKEYVTFVKAIAPNNEFSSISEYSELDKILKANFIDLSIEVDGLRLINIFESSEEQKEYRSKVCEDTYAAIMDVLSTPSPTGLSTPSPTTQPTSQPTAQPTVTPTTASLTPTSAGTLASSSEAPTDLLLLPPSLLPADEPTSEPETEIVSPSPTAVEEPTAIPKGPGGGDDEPTTLPIGSPTTSSDDEPTTQSDDEPTTLPDDEPTTSPADEPTTLPDDEPTTPPDDEPTSVPVPSLAPSVKPPDVPTFSGAIVIDVEFPISNTNGLKADAMQEGLIRAQLEKAFRDTVEAFVDEAQADFPGISQDDDPKIISIVDADTCVPSAKKGSKCQDVTAEFAIYIENEIEEDVRERMEADMNAAIVDGTLQETLTAVNRFNPITIEQPAEAPPEGDETLTVEIGFVTSNTNGLSAEAIQGGMIFEQLEKAFRIMVADVMYDVSQNGCLRRKLAPPSSFLRGYVDNGNIRHRRLSYGLDMESPKITLVKDADCPETANEMAKCQDVFAEYDVIYVDENPAEVSICLEVKTHQAIDAGKLEEQILSLNRFSPVKVEEGTRPEPIVPTTTPTVTPEGSEPKGQPTGGSDDGGGDSMLYIIIGVVVGVLIIILVVCCLLYRRRRKRRGTNLDDGSSISSFDEMAPGGTHSFSVNGDDVQKPNSKYANPFDDDAFDDDTATDDEEAPLNMFKKSTSDIKSPLDDDDTSDGKTREQSGTPFDDKSDQSTSDSSEDDDDSDDDSEDDSEDSDDSDDSDDESGDEDEEEDDDDDDDSDESDDGVSDKQSLNNESLADLENYKMDDVSVLEKENDDEGQKERRLGALPENAYESSDESDSDSDVDEDNSPREAAAASNEGDDKKGWVAPVVGAVAGVGVAGGALFAATRKKKDESTDSDADDDSNSDASDLDHSEQDNSVAQGKNSDATRDLPDNADDKDWVAPVAAAGAVVGTGVVAGAVIASKKKTDDSDQSHGSDSVPGAELATDQDESDTESDESSTNVESELTEEEAQRVAACRAEVEELVQMVVPSEVGNVDAMMNQFRGREAELVSTLRTMHERSVTQRARAAVHKSDQRPLRRPNSRSGSSSRSAPRSLYGGKPVDDDTSQSDSSHGDSTAGSVQGSAVIAAASVPRAASLLGGSIDKQSDSEDDSSSENESEELIRRSNYDSDSSEDESMQNGKKPIMTGDEHDEPPAGQDRFGHSSTRSSPTHNKRTSAHSIRSSDGAISIASSLEGLPERWNRRKGGRD